MPPPWYKGGWMEPLRGGFDMWEYFETIYQVYLRGGGTAEGL